MDLLFFKSNGDKKSSEDYHDIVEDEDQLSKGVKKNTPKFEPFSNLLSWNQGKQYMINSKINMKEQGVSSVEKGDSDNEINHSIEIRLSNDGTKINIGNSYTDPTSPGRSVVEDPFGNIIDPFGDLLSMLNGIDADKVEKTPSKTRSDVIQKDVSVFMSDMMDLFHDVDTIRPSLDKSSDDNFGEFQDAITSNHEDPVEAQDSESDEFGEFQEPQEQSDLDIFGPFQDAKEFSINDRDYCLESFPNHFHMKNHLYTSGNKHNLPITTDDIQLNDSSFVSTDTDKVYPTYSTRILSQEHETFLMSSTNPLIHEHSSKKSMSKEEENDNIQLSYPDENTTSKELRENEQIPKQSSGSLSSQKKILRNISVDESFSEEVAIFEGFEIAVISTNNDKRIKQTNDEYIERRSRSEIDAESSSSKLHPFAGGGIAAAAAAAKRLSSVAIGAPTMSDDQAEDSDINVAVVDKADENIPIIHPFAGGGIAAAAAAAAAKRLSSVAIGAPTTSDDQAEDSDINVAVVDKADENIPIVHPFAGGGIAAAAAAAAAKRTSSVAIASPTTVGGDAAEGPSHLQFEQSSTLDTNVFEVYNSDLNELGIDPILIAARMGSLAWASSKGCDGLPLIVEGASPRCFIDSCNTSLSSATRRNVMSPRNSIISFQTNESNTRKSLIPSQLCSDNMDLSPGSLFSPGQSDSRFYSKSMKNGVSQIIIDPSILSPSSMKWSPKRSFNRNLGDSEREESICENNKVFDISASSSESFADKNDISQNSKMLLACSSFTQHDFSPKESGYIKVATGESKLLQMLASVTWLQMVSNWKHYELLHAMLGRFILAYFESFCLLNSSSISPKSCMVCTSLKARELSHHFTKPQRCATSTFSAHLGTSHPNNLSGFLQDALDWEKTLSPESNNTNGFCPSKLISDPSLIKLSSFLSSLGPLPSCNQLVHTWTKENLKHEMIADNVQVLLKEAEKNLPSFTELVQEITSFSRKKSLSAAAPSYKVDLKSADATLSKAFYKYDQDFLLVKDVLRAYIILQDEAELVASLLYIHRLESANFFKILRIKNLFRTSYFGRPVPTDLPTGYRHILVNIRLQTGLIAEIQLNLKQMYDVLGDAGYALHSDLMKLNYLRQKVDKKAPFQKLCPYTVCACTASDDQDDSGHNFLRIISTYLDSPLKLAHIDDLNTLESDDIPKKSQLEICSSNYRDIYETAVENMEINETGKMNSQEIKLTCKSNTAGYADDEVRLIWNDIRKEVNCVSPLHLIDLLLQAACKSIDANPHDTALYSCIHDIYSKRYMLIRSTVDRENAMKALETSLEITDNANLVGMTGWLDYGKSNILDRVLERPFFTLINLAAFHAMDKDWDMSGSVLRTLLLRCEQHLPLYHPITIVTLLDLSAVLSMLKNHRISLNYMKRARSRLEMYLREQQDACLRIHSMHCCDKNEPFEYYKLVGLDHFSMLHSFCGYMRSLLRRRLLRALPEDHPILLLNRVFLADSLAILAYCLKNSQIRTFNKEHNQRLFELAGEEYRKVAKRFIASKGSLHPNSISMICGVANCLVGSDSTTEALQLMSSMIPPLLQQLDQGYDDQRDMETLVKSESYDADYNIMANKMDLPFKESIASAIRLFANLHVLEMPSAEGRVVATGLLRKALELISERCAGSQSKLSRSMRKVLKIEIEMLVERNKHDGLDDGRESNSFCLHPSTSAAV